MKLYSAFCTIRTAVLVAGIIAILIIATGCGNDTSINTFTDHDETIITEEVITEQILTEDILHEDIR